MPRSPRRRGRDILKAIRERRSIRQFKRAAPSDTAIGLILEAGRWAPSGLNNQPWRFLVIKDAGRREALARLTSCGGILRSAPAVLAVCLDRAASYHREKDLMAVGACIQNMLLEAASLGLGTCWLGEILNQKQKAEKVLGLSRGACGQEFLALIALGTPLKKTRPTKRKELKRLVLFSDGQGQRHKPSLFHHAFV